MRYLQARSSVWSTEPFHFMVEVQTALTHECPVYNCVWLYSEVPCVPWSKRVASLHAYRSLIDNLSEWLRQIVGPLFHLGRPTYAAVYSSLQFLLSVVNCDPKIFHGNYRNKQVHQQFISLKCARHSGVHDEVSRHPAQDITHPLSSVSMLDTLPVC